VLDARDLGLPRARIEDLLVGSPQESAEVIGAVFRGVKGPALDIVLLNAAAGLTVAGRVANLDAGLKLAAGVIDSGAAAKTLARVVELSHAKG
jgi:anthranilate phosphoribosyltransferase